MWLTEVTSALDKRRVKYAVAGGYAVNLNGVPRNTLDIDLVLAWTKPNLLALESAMKDLGLISRLPISAADVFSFREEYISKRNLIAWSFHSSNDPSKLIDILIPHDLKTLNSKTVTVAGHPVEVLAIDDLIKMKRKSGRPQDIEDAKALESRR